MTGDSSVIVDLVAGTLWLVVTLYALTGGADFGGGVWDLLAGGDRRGETPRQFIDRSIAPVWEANHVWLVIVLVVLWTGFPPAFGDIMTTLFVPLSLAAFGIILRGSGFAFRAAAIQLRYRRLSGALFALSSLITPFFFGAAAGAVVTGKVRPGPQTGEIASWTTPTDLTLGALSVVAFAYLAAVYLTNDAERHHPALTEYFRRRALASGIVAGALAALAYLELRHSAPHVADHLTAGAGLGLFVASLVLGATVLIALATRRTTGLRYLAATTFATMLWGWAVAQYPAVLPGTLSLRAAAAPTASLVTELAVVGVIVLIVVPSFALLYRLAQRGTLGPGHSAHQ
jgi:cytochrome bd ubiquinol oxidase subunit II